MRRWKDAATVADLGHLTADWLEGRIRHYDRGHRLDPETSPRMIRTLAGVCRAGYVTTDSQPGSDAPGFDGARWRKRAASSGFVTDPALVGTLRDAARRAGLQVIVDAPAMVVTEREGEPRTWFGGIVRGADLRVTWEGIGRDAWNQVRSAHQVAVLDPAWGESDRLWAVLDQVAGRYR